MLSGQVKDYWKGDPPKGMKIGQDFDVKIQVGGDKDTPFLLYDETKKGECVLLLEFISSERVLQRPKRRDTGKVI
jgi:hypothetical protein